MYSQLLCAKLTSALTLVVVGSLKVNGKFENSCEKSLSCTVVTSEYTIQLMCLEVDGPFFKGSKFFRSYFWAHKVPLYFELSECIILVLQ